MSKDKQASGSKSYNGKALSAFSAPIPIAPGAPIQVPIQGELFIDKQREIDGIGMGVLSDGTAFLTGRGLARLCGVNSARISELAQQWTGDASSSLAKGVRGILNARGISLDRPYVEIKEKGGVVSHAYPESLCVAVLEYYAFDLPNDQAKKNYRLLAGKALHDFIYAQVGYDPTNQVPMEWRQFHDRMSLVYNACPPGYFGIFKEIADIVLHLGQNGLHIDATFIPDISIGMAWAKHWNDNNLVGRFGERTKFQHNYPQYFPQSESNPQEPWCYPEASLGEFRRWIRETYIGSGRFEKYLTEKVKSKALPASFAQLAIASYTEGKPLPSTAPKS